MNLEGNETVLVAANNYITEEVRSVLGAQIFPEGSVVFPKVGGAIATNKKRQIARPSCVDNNVMGLVPDATVVDCDYLHHWMLGQDIYEFSNKANPPSITQSTVKAWPFLLPPLEEQKRIVAVLDQAFAALDRARAHAEANLADVDQLFSAGLEDVLSRCGGRAELTKLGAVCEFENGDRGKNYPGRKAFVAAGVPFINAGHLDSGNIAWNEMNYIPADHYVKLSRGKIRKGDILFCLRGSLGKFGKVDRDGPGAVASSLVIVRASWSVEAGYLCMYFKSAACRRMIDRYAGGAAQPNLSAADLKGFELLLPKRDDQLRAIEAHDSLLAKTSALKAVFVRKLADLATLRQTLLQKAFSGELT